MVRTFDAPIDGRGRRFAIVTARFNEHVTRRLLDGALRAFSAQGVPESNVDVIWVPGSFEIPLAAKWAIETLGSSAVLALGAIIRGETAHFDFVAKAATDGVLSVGLQTGRPVIFGVLTVDTLEQALARASDGPDNKGFDAALCALEMTSLERQMRLEAKGRS